MQLCSLRTCVVVRPGWSTGDCSWLPQHLQISSAAPATQILMLLSVAANWPNAQARWIRVGSLVDIITFKYYYPRNRLLFTAPLNESPERLALVAKQWANET